MKLYAIHDRVKPSTPRPVDEVEASRLNEQGYGIFWVVNTFQGRRLQGNLERINYWYTEIDTEDKPYQLLQIENGPLLPSLVIESARGYHVYWKARDATRDQWKLIERGLVEHYGGDPKCTDPLRLLRCPGFLHNKAEPFPVEAVWEAPQISYTEEQMLTNYPVLAPTKSGELKLTKVDSDFHIDARVGLPLLNGSPLMAGEHFRLEPVGNGNFNIMRIPDNYSTGCWIDDLGLIGGNHYGVTLGAWLRWYGASWTEIKKAIQRLKDDFESLVERMSPERIRSASFVDGILVVKFGDGLAKAFQWDHLPFATQAPRLVPETTRVGEDYDTVLINDENGGEFDVDAIALRALVVTATRRSSEHISQGVGASKGPDTEPGQD